MLIGPVCCSGSMGWFIRMWRRLGSDKSIESTTPLFQLIIITHFDWDILCHINKAICFYTLTINVKAEHCWDLTWGWWGLMKKLWLWTLGGAINEVVNIGVSSMAALRRPLLQGRGRAEGYSVRSWQLSQNQSRILKWTLCDVRCNRLCQVFWIPATC